MLVTFTDCKDKKIVINSDNVSYITEHEISGTTFHFENKAVRVKEAISEVLSKIKLK